MATNKEKIVLGSGEVYITEHQGDIPEIAAIKAEENRLGHIQGGASVEYTPTHYTAKDDFGKVTKTIITEETAVLKLGICTWCGNTLAKLCSTARVTEADGKRTVKIGGTGCDNGKSYVILFYHHDAKDGDIYVLIVGRNQAALSLVYAKDKETVINPEFAAEPQDEEGTLIQYVEEIPS